MQATAADLLHGRVPASWEALWDGPASPGDYMRAAVAKASALEAVGLSAEQQQQQGVLGHISERQPLQLAALFRPAALLDALRQQAARAAGLPLAALRLISCWPGGRLPPACPLALHAAGLQLQGALFDGRALAPAWQVRAAGSYAWCTQRNACLAMHITAPHACCPLPCAGLAAEQCCARGAAGLGAGRCA